MKQRKLFLGVTTSLLTLAAIAASKAARFSTLYAKYYCTIALSHCATVLMPCDNTSTDPCTVTFDFIPMTYTVYNLNLHWAVDGCKFNFISKCIDRSTRSAFE